MQVLGRAPSAPRPVFGAQWVSSDAEEELSNSDVEILVMDEAAGCVPLLAAVGAHCLNKTCWRQKV